MSGSIIQARTRLLLADHQQFKEWMRGEMTLHPELNEWVRGRSFEEMWPGLLSEMCIGLFVNARSRLTQDLFAGHEMWRNN